MANFNPGAYGIIIRIMHGSLIASSPEFGIVITKRFDEVRRAEEIGKLYMDVFTKISDEIKHRTQLSKPIPEPKKPVDLIPKNDPPTLSVADVARILETSQDTVRRLVADKKLRCVLTRGGHRRFRVSDLSAYQEIRDASIAHSFIKMSVPPEVDQ